MTIFESLYKLNPLPFLVLESFLRVVTQVVLPSITRHRLGPGEIPNESGSGDLPTFCTAMAGVQCHTIKNKNRNHSIN